MPPKKQNAPSKKNEIKKKDRVIEDKTFGMKNKKGTKQQKFIQQVVTQVQSANTKESKLKEQERKDKDKKKDEKQRLQDEINALFKPVEQKLAKGVDPKSVLCGFFKQGTCKKGDKCKFSHDLNVERKDVKRQLYEEKKEETMADWDEATLEDVVNQKHGESNKAKPKTAIICKHFLDAVENNKYGWFWECPNKAKCIYKHSLPPGFELNRDKKKLDKEAEVSIEELVEIERAALGYNTTKVTLETFLKWKERKRREKLDELKKETDKKKAQYKSGQVGGISGRQMFEFNPELKRGDEDEEGGAVAFEREEEEKDDCKAVEVDFSYFKATEVDKSGTQAQSDRLANGTAENGESSKLGEAAAFPDNPKAKLQEDTDAAIAAAVDATINGDLDIDEDLFGGDDIDLIEEDLETLELEDDPSL